MAKTTTPVTVKMTKLKEHKKVIRYTASDDQPITSVYIDKDTVAELGDPEFITLTVAAS